MLERLCAMLIRDNSLATLLTSLAVKYAILTPTPDRRISGE